jgi:RNA polymerase sigma factor (sigma-70 family)
MINHRISQAHTRSTRRAPAVRLGRVGDARSELEDLVGSACSGDEQAWARLVARFDPMARRVARGFGLAPCDVDDVVGSAWVRIYSSLAAVREPDALSGWIATIVRREALRILQVAAFERLIDDPVCFGQTTEEGPLSSLLASEQTETLTDAIASLPPRQGMLIALLFTHEQDYRAISARLDMPIGSIGPIRRRGLARLGQSPEIRSLLD